MSKYTHHSRSRIPANSEDKTGRSVVSRNSTGFDEDDDNIGPPQLSNFGSALLARSGDSGNGTSFLSRMQMADPTTESQTRSQTVNTHTVTSHSQFSMFGQGIDKTAGATPRPLSTTTVNDEHTRDSTIQNEKLRGMQQQMKDELTSKYTERRINRMLLSSNRLSRLGPAKRMSSLQTTGPIESPRSVTNTRNLSDPSPMNHAIVSPTNTEAIERSTEPLNDYSNIDFGDLNPLQYLKKHNLPSSELPHISKVYFEKRKAEIRRTALRKYSTSKELLLSRSKYIDDNAGTTPDRSDVHTPQRSIPLPETEALLPPVSQEQENQPQSIMSTITKGQKKREALSNLSINKKEPEHKKTKKVEIQEPVKHRSSTVNTVTVNDKEYERIELLGRGGSSKVYKVKGPGNKVYAMKRVIFDEFDETSLAGFKGEIELLQKLRHEDRVVHLYDDMIDQGLLYLIMECGDFDLSQILNRRLNDPLDVEFIRYYMREMLLCLKVVHETGIVHSDLKPANFVVVKGKLKIIDFGIANAVPDHTVNIYRDTQIGTPNYMAPEALVALNMPPGISEGSSSETRSHVPKNTWKVGKPSDIWSCGCILYQMVYGRPPYAGYQGQSRLLAIMNPDVRISYPERTERGEAVPHSLLELIRQCLERDPVRRCTVDQMLRGPFLKPVVVTEFFLRDLIKNAVTFGAKQRHVSDDKIDALTNDVLGRLEEFKM